MTDVAIPKISHILVNRLAAVYDPFVVLFGKALEDLPARWFIVPPRADHVEVRARDEEYDRGRIVHFVEEPSLEAIELDNAWYRCSAGSPIVVDGHHRLCAAILARRRRIACSYSGVVETLRWLEGKGRFGVRPWEE